MMAVPCDPQDRLAICTLHALGLRLGELVGLRTDDIDLAAGTVLVRGKGQRQRVLPLPTSLASRIAAHTAGRCQGAAVFVTASGEAMAAHTMGLRVRAVLEAAGVKRAPHDGRSAHCLRHTCASEVLEAGAPLHVVRELLGHRNVATTSIYLRRVDLAALRLAVAER
jgi:site-specific recombinase XerD